MKFVFSDLPERVSPIVLRRIRENFAGHEFESFEVETDIEIERPLSPNHIRGFHKEIHRMLNPREFSQDRQVCLLSVSDYGEDLCNQFLPYFLSFRIPGVSVNSGEDRFRQYWNSIFRGLRESLPEILRTSDRYCEMLKGADQWKFLLPLETYGDKWLSEELRKLANFSKFLADIDEVMQDILTSLDEKRNSLGWRFEPRNRLLNGQRAPTFSDSAQLKRPSCQLRASYRLGCYVGSKRHFRLNLPDLGEFSHFGCHNTLSRFNSKNDHQIFLNDFLRVG